MASFVVKMLFLDLVVSAPLENQGAIYVFYGSQHGIIETYVQRISPEQLKPLPNFINKFGPTVVGKVDVDKNGYTGYLLLCRCGT